MIRYSRFRPCSFVMIALATVAALPSVIQAAPAARPNILFAVADDWGWPHAGAYGDPVVKTPTFDRLAEEGALFHNAFVSSPSCTPSRGAILTGQWHWRLKGAANLWSVFPDEFDTYPELLKKAGYATGVTGKGWGPGKTKTVGRQLVGRPYRSFRAFLDKRDSTKPFCFWLGSSDPHRPYELGSGKASGIDLDKVKLFGCFPNTEVVRSDVADYYVEVQRFDSLVGQAVMMLEEIGELDNTIVLMTGDHNMPFPRCKGNLYDCGSRVPLAVRWKNGLQGGRVVDGFVSFTDFAPTFLEVAGVAIPDDMTGHSLAKLLQSTASPGTDPNRDFTLIGKERHCPAQEGPNMGGYPCRAIRTHEFLYIRNFDIDRWPAGTPNWRVAAFPGAWIGDCDNGPTKTYMVEHRDADAKHRELYDLAFGKRPAEELYDVKKDPDQLNNVADDPAYAEAREQLAARLMKLLRESEDPRALGGGDEFDRFPYLGGAPLHPEFQKGKSKKK